MREPMACPRCGERMTPGWLRLKGSLAGTLLVGWRWEHLWWSDRDDTRESRRKVITNGTVVGAAQCVACTTIAFLPAEE